MTATLSPPKSDPPSRSSAGRRGAEVSGRVTTGGLNWAWLVARTIHPIKVAILEALRWIDRPVTATDLWRSVGVDEYGQRDVAYHARKLEKLGALVEVERVPFRFVTESYYVLSDELAGVG